MDKKDHYEISQKNLKLLNLEIKLVKKSVQSSIGEYEWYKENCNDYHQIESKNQNMLALTRLYTFLICSWFESRLNKIFYENSANGFTMAEIKNINRKQNKLTMENKWKIVFAFSIAKSYGFPYPVNSNTNYSYNFPKNSMALNNYLNIMNLFQDITDSILTRNRLAHGQWHTQYNSNKTAIKTPNFISNYNNIQQLHNVMKEFDIIGEIISEYVKAINKDQNFDLSIHEKIKKIYEIKTRINNSDYSKYTTNLKNKYKKNRDRLKQIEALENTHNI